MNHGTDEVSEQQVESLSNFKQGVSEMDNSYSSNDQASENMSDVLGKSYDFRSEAVGDTYSQGAQGQLTDSVNYMTQNSNAAEYLNDFQITGE